MLVFFASLHPLFKGLSGGVHDALEVGTVVIGECAARQRHELVAGADLEPGVASKDIVPVGIGDIELLSAILEAVVETGARCAQLDFVFVHLGQFCGIDLADASREEDGLALLDVDLEIARHIEVLGVGDAALLVLDILDALVPVRVKDEFRFLAHLHIEGGVTVVHAGGDAVAYIVIVAACNIVLHAQVIGIAEGEERSELQRSLGVRIYERVADDDAVLVGDKNLLPLEDDSAHAEGVCGQPFAVVFADVFVPVGAENIALILVDAQVEGGIVLNDGLVKR